MYAIMMEDAEKDRLSPKQASTEAVMLLSGVTEL